MLVIAVISIVALVSLGRAMFRHSPTDGKTEVKQSSKATDTKESKSTPENPLLNTDTDRGVTMSVRGPIVGDEDFRSYKIEITPGSRRMTTYEGYLQDKLDSSSHKNNKQAYTELVYALDKANFMAGKSSGNDLRGVCATGYVYEFSITQGGNTVKKLWTSTCSGAPGSLAANLDQITSLFKHQIPDFYHLSDTVDLP